jgi:hypothetical protein
MGPVKIFVAGTITGFVVRPYVQRAAQSLLMSAIQSVEKTQNELDQVEKLKAEAEAAKAQALKLEEEARRLRDDALQATMASGPVTTPT